MCPPPLQVQGVNSPVIERAINNFTPMTADGDEQEVREV